MASRASHFPATSFQKRIKLWARGKTTLIGLPIPKTAIGPYSRKGAPWKLAYSNIFLKVGKLAGSAKTRQSILEARGSLSSRFPLTLPGFAFQTVNNSSHLLGLIMCLACVQKKTHVIKLLNSRNIPIR